MARNRIIYQSLALYAGQTNAQSGDHTTSGTVQQLTRVQSWDSDFSRNFTDVTQYGQLAPIDRIEVEAPTVNMSTSWYPTDGFNEKTIGLSVCGSGQTPNSLLSGILKKETDEKNYFLMVVGEGSDAVGFNGPKTGCFGLGNCFLTSYSLEGGVGEIPTASADFEALNFAVYSDITGVNNVPAINPTSGTKIVGVPFRLPSTSANTDPNQITVLRPGDITLNLVPTSGPAYVKGFSADDIKIQKFSLKADLKRTPIEKLGSRFPFSREIDFPLTATLSVDSQMGDLDSFNLSDLLCETGFYDLTISMRENSCSGDGQVAILAQLKGAKLKSENLSTAIGSNATVKLDYEVSIGGPEEITKGIFISGSYPTV